jgi:hypothetical protein
MRSECCFCRTRTRCFHRFELSESGVAGGVDPGPSRIRPQRGQLHQSAHFSEIVFWSRPCTPVSSEVCHLLGDKPRKFGSKAREAAPKCFGRGLVHPRIDVGKRGMKNLRLHNLGRPVLSGSFS